MWSGGRRAGAVAPGLAEAAVGPGTGASRARLHRGGDHARDRTERPDALTPHEEAVYTNAAFNELIIFTTSQPSSTRLYTLAHNHAYRYDMTVKGYMQSHHVDYFIGAQGEAAVREFVNRRVRPNIADWYEHGEIDLQASEYYGNDGIDRATGLVARLIAVTGIHGHIAHQKAVLAL